MSVRRGAAGATWFLPALSAAFFFSGASALIYQILWLRMLGLVFGVTVYAASTVWASFMAGLAVGSVAAGRLGDRVRRPLVWFGIAELSIGVTAASTPLVFHWLRGLYPSLGPLLGESFAAATALRFGVSFAVLLVPTALMGATLPLVVKSSLFRPAALGRSAGILYATNTTGAIVGALASGMYLLPRVGMSRTFAIAAALNGIVAVTAWILSARAPAPADARGDDAASPAAAIAAVSAASPAARRIVLLMSGISGAVALALEIIWLRVIVLWVGPTVYAFSILLACVLLGNALGSYAISAVLRKGGRWLTPLMVLESAIAFAGLLSVVAMAALPQATAHIPPSLGTLVPPYLVPIIGGGIVVALPTTILMGLAFPIGLHLWSVRGEAADAGAAASRVGVYYAVNVCGGIAGSLAAGFVLLPMLGSRVSLIAASAAVLAGAVALVAVTPLRLAVRGATAVALVVAFTAAAIALPDPVPLLLGQRHPNEPVVWREEGVQSTVSVTEIMGGARHAMYSEGYHQADDTGSMAAYHYEIGTLPMAIHPNPRTALIVGLGGGATAGAIARHPGVQLDVVELSDTVVRASEFFRRLNLDLLRRPNVRLHVNDGRDFLALTKQKYDVITADTIQPVRAGAASLYSLEYFRLVHNALNENGVAMQWFAGTNEEYKLVARTFQTVFPYTTVWGEDGGLLLGTKQPLRLRRADFTWKLAVPERLAGFESIGIRTFEDLLGRFRAGPDELRRFVGEGPLLTDDRPILEYFLSLPRDPEDLSTLRGDVAQILD